MEMTIVENLQRADLNPMEQARAYDRLGHQFKMTQEQMAQRTGKDSASVANFLGCFVFRSKSSTKWKVAALASAMPARFCRWSRRRQSLKPRKK